MNSPLDTGALSGMEKVMTRLRVQAPNFNLLLGLAFNPQIQTEVKELYQAVTQNGMWLEFNLRDPIVIGALMGWGMTRYLEGAWRSRGLARQFRREFQVLTPRRSQFFEFAGRMKTVWKRLADPGASAEIFNPDLTRVQLPKEDDEFGYLLGEAASFIKSGLGWNEWVDLRERTIGTLEGRFRDTVVRDAYELYRGLVPAGTPLRPFAQFSLELITRPTDQGWVVGWVQNFIQRRIDLRRPLGREAREMIARVGLPV